MCLVHKETHVDKIKQGHNYNYYFPSHLTSLSHYSENPQSHPTPEYKYPISHSLFLIRFLNLGFQEGDPEKPLGLLLFWDYCPKKINK